MVRKQGQLKSCFLIFQEVHWNDPTRSWITILDPVCLFMSLPANTCSEVNMENTIVSNMIIAWDTIFLTI